jgi:outer membrane protein TolC
MRRVLVAVVSLGIAQVAGAQELDGGTPFVSLELDGGAGPTLPLLPEDDGGVERVGLAEAVQRALQKNPSVVTAFDELQRGYALLEQTRASWLPTLNANATFTRLDADRQLQGRTIIGANQFNANLTLAVPLFNPRVWLAYGSAKNLLASTNANAEDAKRLLAVAVGRAYLSCLAQHRILEADRRALSAATAHRDFAQARFTGGVGNRVDLVRAKQTLANDESLVEGARTNLARAREALGVLMGEDRPFDVREDVTLSRIPAQDVAESELAKRRQDLAALQLRADIADELVDHKWADYVPLLNATFQPFFQEPASLTTPRTGFQAVLALTWPIYDGGLRYGQERERAILGHEAHQQAAGASRQARSDVRGAFEAVQHADASLLAARDATKLSREALELVTLAYRAGATTNIEVIDAERIALDSETQAAVAEDAARQARLDLLSATGRFP